VPATPLRTILVGTDGSPGAAKALAWAIDRAAESTARLLVVHVLTYNTEFRRDSPIGLDTITTWRRDLRLRLHNDWAAPAMAAGRDVACEIEEADTPAAGIVAAAARAAVDLIVLGAHGHGSLADRILGATTYKVSHSASTPVVIIPVDWQPTATAA
jgi:nucleotide-binding universal stress UspA family protein